MAKKKVTTKKKAVESKKSVKKAVAKPEKVADNLGPVQLPHRLRRR